MENQTQVATQEQKKEVKEFETSLSKATDAYMGVIKKQMEEGGATFDEYSGKCVLSAMGAINGMIHNQGVKFNEINTSNMNEILIKVASLKLNASASPRECYFQMRNVNASGKGQQDNWEKQIEFGIEGDGNDAILARFGRDVKKVAQVWLVRSGDNFTYPMHNGLETTAPQWQPTGKGNVVRVVYPIIKNDNTVEYYIGERADVVRNLMAHISNNLMNETFGIAESRFKATPKQKEQIAAKKKEIMNKVKGLGDLDSILDCEELAPYISPAWLEPQSSEQMIIRKMRNNVAKKIPKDFGNQVAATQYNMLDDNYREVRAEIEDNANSVVYTMEPEEAEVEKEVKEPADTPKDEVKEQREKRQEKVKETTKKAEEPKEEPKEEPNGIPSTEPEW